MKQLLENWKRFLTEAKWGIYFSDMPDQLITFHDTEEEARERAGRLQKRNADKLPPDVKYIVKPVEDLDEEMVKLNESIDLDIEIGDILLGGKYKNKRTVVKEIGEDDIGQPTINGKPLLNFRIEKQLPDSKKSKQTLEDEKEKSEK